MVSFRSDMTVRLIDHMGDDYSPIQAARVSTQGAGSQNTADSAGLRRYLLRERHMVPFETQVMRFYIEAPIFVTRQILKHRISSISEESGRYRELEPVFYVPHVTRKVEQVGKTGEYKFRFNREKVDKAQEEIMQASTGAWQSYQTLLDSGVAKEVARMVLPLNIYSSMYITMNTVSLMNFFTLRTRMKDSKPQDEIEQVAKQMYSHWMVTYPLTAEQWRET